MKRHMHKKEFSLKMGSPDLHTIPPPLKDYIVIPRIHSFFSLASSFQIRRTQKNKIVVGLVC